MSKKNKKVYNIPNLSDNINENIEILIEQASMLSNKAGNLNEHLDKFCLDFRKSVTDKNTVNYLFWKLVELHFQGGWKREGIIRHAMTLFKPYEFYVYQLIKEGTVVYVGKTDRSHDRMVAHKKDKDFDEVRYFQCSGTNQQDIIENTHIFKLKPKYNKNVRLDLVDHSMSVLEFLKTDEIKPDFIPISGGEGKISACDNYHYIQFLGFVSKDKVKNTPYWFSEKYLEFKRQKSILDECSKLIYSKEFRDYIKAKISEITDEKLAKRCDDLIRRLR